MIRTVLAAAALVALVGGFSPAATAALTDNALTQNELTENALTSNGLGNNALA